MSELTRCNYCTLKAIKAREAPKVVEAIQITDPDEALRGWMRVQVDGEPIEVYLMQLTTSCVC